MDLSDAFYFLEMANFEEVQFELMDPIRQEEEPLQNLNIEKSNVRYVTLHMET